MPEIKELLGKESLLAIKDYIDNNKSDIEQDLSTKEDKSNKVTSLSDASTDTQYPSAKAVYDKLITKQNVIDSTHRLLSDLVDDTNQEHKFVSPEVKDFVDSEWEKGLNVCNEDLMLLNKAVNSSNGTIMDYNNYRANETFFSIKPNTTYSKTNNAQIYFFDAQQNYLGTSALVTYATTTFVSPNNAYYIRIECNDLTNQIMLNEGDHVYPHQDYHGSIVHEKDIENVVTIDTAQTIIGKKTFTENPVIYGIDINGTGVAFFENTADGSNITAEGHITVYGDDDSSDSSKPANQTGASDLDTTLFNTGICLNDSDGVADSYKISFPGKSGTFALTNDIYEETTWSALKTLRDNSQLVPGKFYRITDYTCTTTQENTSSAGHVFDIIVRADSVNKLNEEASAILHSGDTYFASNNLSAWKLWYCLDNDTTRFAWAQALVEEHLIYVGMECFRETQYDGVNGNYCWKFMPNEYIFTDTLDNPTTGSYWRRYAGDGSWTKLRDSVSVQYVPSSSEGKGVIYRMIDEFDNDCPYDFKNVLFTKSGKYTNAYTFSYTEDSTIKDASLFGLSKSCYNNIIKEYIKNNKLHLNFNVFYGTSNLYCYDNILNFGCYNNTFGFGCHDNILNLSCYDNTFGYSCGQNILNNYCHNNIFGTSCNNNIFGNACYYINFGSNCSENILGILIGYITFGDSSSTIGYCNGNIIDSHCEYLYINSVGSAAYNNILQNIHIHSGVSGTYSNRKTITVDRNLQYETNIVPAGTTTIEV